MLRACRDPSRHNNPATCRPPPTRSGPRCAAPCPLTTADTTGGAAMSASESPRKTRPRARVVGYGCPRAAPAATERIARLGYDYVCLDGQHGLLGHSGLLAGLTAIDAGGAS